MGQLVEGVWIKNKDLATSDNKGAFQRPDSGFREGVGKNHLRFQPEKNRYHLYVSYACPWAHRALIFRELKGLLGVIGVSVVHPHMLDEGWTFETDFDGATGDLVNDKKLMYEIYQEADPKVSSRVTVPVLWDQKEQTIVNN